MTNVRLTINVRQPMKISQVIQVLNEMQAAGVIREYAIGGAVGASFYLEPVSTLDIDVFATFGAEPGAGILNPQPVFDYLSTRGYRWDGEYVIIADWPVQLLPPPGALAEEALREAKAFDLEGTTAKVFSPEHLAALALQTGRAKDKLRLNQFIEEGSMDPARFLNIIRRHNLEPAWIKFQQQLGPGAS